MLPAAGPPPGVSDPVEEEADGADEGAADAVEALDDGLIDPAFADRLLAVADQPPLAPWEPDGAERRALLPLELLGWDERDQLVGVRCEADRVLLAEGRPARRRPLTVTRLTRWARAGRVTLHCAEGDVQVRLLAPEEYAGLSLGDARDGRVAGPVRMARAGQRSSQRDRVAGTLVARVVRVLPDVQVGTG